MSMSPKEQITWLEGRIADQRSEITRLRAELEKEKRLRVQLANDSQMHLDKWQACRAENDDLRATLEQVASQSLKNGMQADQLRAEVEALRADAERWRTHWPRIRDAFEYMRNESDNAELFAAIDAARTDENT